MGMKYLRGTHSDVRKEFPQIMSLENTAPIMTMHFMNHIREEL